MKTFRYLVLLALCLPAGAQTINLQTQVRGLLPPANGGLGVAPTAADQIPITTSATVIAFQQMYNCASDGLHGLAYSTSTHSFVCVTLTAGAPSWASVTNGASAATLTMASGGSLVPGAGTIAANWLNGVAICSGAASATGYALITSSTTAACWAPFSGGSVTAFTAPTGSWPSWLVPTVTNPSSTPNLAVTASAIPNSALANPSTTVNGQTCTLGAGCTIPISTIDGVTVSGAAVSGDAIVATSPTAATWQPTPLLNGANLWGSAGANNFLGPVGMDAPGTATSSANVSSSIFSLEDSYWNGTLNQNDIWQWQAVPGAGTNPPTTMVLSEGGRSGGTSRPALLLSNTAPATSGANFPAISISQAASYWNGTATATDPAVWTYTPGTGTNPNMTYTLTLGAGGSTGTHTIAFGNPFTAPSVTAQLIGNVYYADQRCTTAGTYDQSCLANTITAAGSNSTIVLPPHTYNFASTVALSGLVNVTIEGNGPSTIISAGTLAITCTSCINFKVKDMNFQSTTTPTVVASSQLPTASGSTPVVIERMGSGAQVAITAYSITSNVPCFTASNAYATGQVAFINGFPASTFFNATNFVVSSTGLSSTQFCGSNPQFTHANTSATETGYSQLGSGYGYIPTANDSDLVPIAAGGSCTTGCLSATQSAEAFDGGIEIIGGIGIEESGLTGNYYSLIHYDSSLVNVHNNLVSGGKNFAGAILFWRNNSTSSSNHQITIANNTINYPAFSGITLVGDHFTVSGNTISYGGESGVKTYQNAPNQVSHAAIQGNVASYNWFDGFDLGSTYPHVSTFDAESTAAGNTASYNHGTGFYGDGQHWTFTGNVASYNWAPGISLDDCNSTISSNTVAYNGWATTSTQNAAVDGAGSALTGCGGASYNTNNVVSSNTFVKGTTAQYALYHVGKNKLSNNQSPDGLIFDAVGDATDWNDSDSGGLHAFNCQGSCAFANSVTATKYNTTLTCYATGNPTACNNYPAGGLAIGTGSSTLVVDDTAVTAVSQIHVWVDNSLGTALSVTCAPTIAYMPTISARTVGVSFTISLTGTVAGSPECFGFSIQN